MNGRISKKLRKLFKKNYKLYHNQLCDLKYWDRLYMCWDIMRRYKYPV